MEKFLKSICEMLELETFLLPDSILSEIEEWDSLAVVSLIMESFPGPSKPEIRGDSVFYSLNERSWPLVLRCDFDNAGKVKVIFIYRNDI